MKSELLETQSLRTSFPTPVVTSQPTPNPDESMFNSTAESRKIEPNNFMDSYYNFFSPLDSQPINFFTEFLEYVKRHPEAKRGIENLLLKYQENGTLNFEKLVEERVLIMPQYEKDGEVLPVPLRS
jgi:hypothetical protein